MRPHGEGLVLERCSPLRYVVLERVQLKIGGKYPRANDRWSFFFVGR